MRLLVVNAGSSSLKLAALDGDDRVLAERTVEWPTGGAFPHDALDGLPEPDVVAHRVVHGGDSFRAATWIDDDVRSRLVDLTELAPLHQPRAGSGPSSTYSQEEWSGWPSLSVPA